MAAAAGRQVQSLVAVDRPEQRVPVGRHVVEADAPGDGPHSGEAGQPRDDAVADVLLERLVDRLVEGFGIGRLVLLREAAADEDVTVPVLGCGRK